MYEFIKNNTLIITNNKNNIIKYISSLDKLINIKVITPKELISNYYFNYNDKTIYYLMNKYNIKYDIAKIYINNMYYVNESSTNNKINKIYEIKKDLIDNNLLITNNYFKEYLNNKNIVIYNMYNIPNIIKDILSNYKYEVINDNSNNYKHSIYEFNTLDDEVAFVANKCVELINNNIDINKIYLTNLNDEYRLIIKRIFSMFNIPILLNDNYSIYNTHTSNLFLEYYESNINNTLNKLEENITKSEIDIYNKIVNICNKYIWCDDYIDIKELIINDLKNTNIDISLKENVIKEISIDTHINSDEYVFLLGFNQGIIPSIKKDEDYFSDKDKLLLNIETSY